MTIKNKLRLGFGFLFAIVLCFGAISLYYINRISASSNVILKDNYESLKYTGAMRSILDKGMLPLSETAELSFEKNLHSEEQNLTEPGEKELTALLRSAFMTISDPSVSKDTAQHTLVQARLRLHQIEQLNMDAIVRKNKAAQESVKEATIYLSFAACFCFLVLFSFSVNFPGFVANPLRELSMGIRQISKQNYRQRLETNGDDEFSEVAAAFNEMAKRLNEWDNTNVAKLKSEKLRIEAIIGQMQDAIVGLNEKNEILFINQSAAQILNLDAGTSIGKSAQELAGKNDLLRRMMDNDAADKQLKIYADGKESYFQLDSQEIKTAAEQPEDGAVNLGASAGKVFLLRNITQFKELDTAKTNFIATVSHELKTPISSIKMSLKLLADTRVGAMNTEQLDLIHNIRDDSDRLLKITSELLDLSRAETGNLQLQFAATDPNVILNYAIDAIKFQAEQKQVKLELISSRTLPNVLADTEKTAWVLINFLSNALRYSPEKSRILVQAVRKGVMVEFSVRDFGNGIDPQYQKRLFDRYFQVPTDGKNKSGSGLGLAISKDFIEAGNGRIWVESEIGEGSRFCFSLPLA